MISTFSFCSWKPRTKSQSCEEFSRKTSSTQIVYSTCCRSIQDFLTSWRRRTPCIGGSKYCKMRVSFRCRPLNSLMSPFSSTEEDQEEYQIIYPKKLSTKCSESKKTSTNKIILLLNSRRSSSRDSRRKHPRKSCQKNRPKLSRKCHLLRRCRKSPKRETKAP